MIIVFGKLHRKYVRRDFWRKKMLVFRFKSERKIVADTGFFIYIYIYQNNDKKGEKE